MARLAGIRLEVLTGRDKGDARANILTDLAEGRIDILVGTHAVIQKTVEFHDLRLAIIDEQHRFGVNQRMELGTKGAHLPPDMLVMTATPIPRSLVDGPAIWICRCWTKSRRADSRSAPR